MTCLEAQEIAGEALDGSLNDAVRAAFFGHLDACHPCRREYKLEEAARAVIRRRVHHVSVPDSVRRSVIAALRDERQTSAGTWTGWWSSLFQRYPVPALGAGFAVVLIAFLLIPTGPDDGLIRHAAANDVINQAASNFVLIRDGKVKPALTSCSPDQIHAYLNAQHVPFQVSIRPIETCDGYSVIVNEYDGVPLAHVVYKLGDDLLYVYQVRRAETMGTSAHLSMPQAAYESLERTGWYTDPDHPDCNVVMWQEGGTLCAAASTMKKERMMAVLARDVQ